jgi:hypothetical protein
VAKLSLNDQWWRSFINKAIWLLIFVVVLFSLILSTKILGLKLETNIKLNTDSVLTFVIAFFSLGLSIMFYFKTEETSNRFYDNTYKFTADVSRTLAEIRAEFGEHLKHLDTGYSKIADAVSPPSDILKNLEETKRDLEEEKSERLGKNTKSKDLNKESLLQIVRALEKKIDAADKNINKVLNEASTPIRDRALSHTRKRVVDKLGGRSIIHISDQVISKRFKDLISEGELNQQYIKDLQALSFIDNNGFLSQEFIDHIRQYAHQSKQL